MPKPRKGAAEPPGSDDDQQGPPLPPKPRNPDADPVKIHREYVERRLGGGARATPEAYARALEQWHRLPGAVSTPPSEISGADAEPSPEKEGHQEPDEDAGQDKERGL